MLKQIKHDWKLSGQNVAACMTIDKVKWLIAEVERLRAKLDATKGHLRYSDDPFYSEADEAEGGESCKL